MPNSVLPIKFLFTFRTVRFESCACTDFRLALRRSKSNSSVETKVTKSKSYLYQLAGISMNETIEFPTMLELSVSTKNYEKKTLSLQIELRGSSGRACPTLFAKELNLADFAGFSQPQLFVFDFKEGEAKAEVHLEVVSQVNTNGDGCISEIIDNSKCAKSIAKLGLQNETTIAEQQQILEKEEIDKAKSLKSVRKSRGWLTIVEQEDIIQGASPQPLPETKAICKASPVQRSDKIHNTGIIDRLQKSPTRRRESKSQLDIQPITSKPTACRKSRDNKSLVDNERQKYKQKKMVRIEEENNDHNSKHQDDSETCRISIYPKSLRSFEVDSVVEHRELLEENKKLKKEMEEMRVKLSELEFKEDKSVSLQKNVIERLKQELTVCNRKVKELEENLEKNHSEKLELETKAIFAETKARNLQLELQRRSIEYEARHSAKRRDGSPDWKVKYTELKRQYQSESADLNARLSQLKRQKGTNESQILLAQEEGHICLDKECEKQKRELKQTTRKNQRLIETLESKLKTKDKLLDNYNRIENDREKENIGRSEHDKLRAQKIVLENHLSQLKQQLNSQSVPLLSKATDQHKRRSDRESMQKDLQKIRRSYYELTQQREQEHRNLQEQIKSSKLQVMNVLNAVNEFGGRKLYDQISEVLFQ